MMVVLEGCEPKIWRQISVPGNMTLADLDRIIQAAMGWTNSHLHQFTIEGQVYGVLDDEKRNSWPMCLAGANACPPEDVGGLGGYEEFLEAIGDPLHEEHDSMRRWYGGPFNPQEFD